MTASAETTIDRLLDAAERTDREGAFVIVVSARFGALTAWARGKKVYRFCSVALSTTVPATRVVLAPAPDNIRSCGRLREYVGDLETGDITITELTSADEEQHA